jgi:polyisoprenoid-binding protein YceI
MQIEIHLLSADFLMLLSFQKLNLAQPFIKINEGEYELVGDLTLHGVTKSVKLAADMEINERSMGKYQNGTCIRRKINRKDWD